MKKNKGMVMMELLVALMIGVLIIPIVVSLLSLLTKVDLNSSKLQNDIGIVQLRYHLMKAYEYEVEDDCLSYFIKDKNYVLNLKNGRLIQQEGTLIFLIDIDEVYFYEEDGYYLEYLYNGKWYKERIAYEY